MLYSKTHILNNSSYYTIQISFIYLFSKNYKLIQLNVINYISFGLMVN